MPWGVPGGLPLLALSWGVACRSYSLGENLLRGFRNITVILGGGGVFGAAVLAGVLAVLLAEIVGEIRERIHRT